MKGNNYKWTEWPNSYPVADTRYMLYLEFQIDLPGGRTGSDLRFEYYINANNLVYRDFLRNTFLHIHIKNIKEAESLVDRIIIANRELIDTNNVILPSHLLKLVKERVKNHKY